HTVTVRATDSAGLTFDKQFTIGVTNVNEPPTDIALSHASVAENSANGTVVGSLSDTDQDIGDSAPSTLTNNLADRVSICRNDIRGAGRTLPALRSPDLHAVTVQVTDSGGLTFDKQFTIGVANVNEAPTNIALSHASVAENSANGTVVGSLSDTDPDA